MPTSGRPSPSLFPTTEGAARRSTSADDQKRTRETRRIPGPMPPPGPPNGGRHLAYRLSTEPTPRPRNFALPSVPFFSYCRSRFRFPAMANLRARTFRLLTREAFVHDEFRSGQSMILRRGQVLFLGQSIQTTVSRSRSKREDGN